MPNRQVALVLYVKTSAGWRRYPAAFGKNGRVKPGVGLVSGVEQKFPHPRYQLRLYEGRRIVYRDAGPNASAALVTRDRERKLLEAKNAATLAGTTVAEPETRRLLSRELRRFIEAARDRGSMKAAETYDLAAEEFLLVTRKTYVDELKPEDLTRYHRALRGRGCADRTVYNRDANVRSFLLWLGFDLKKLKVRKPRYQKTVPEIYSRQEMQDFLAVIGDQRLRLGFELLLEAGLREKELVYLEWTRIDTETGTVKVRPNPAYGFRIKDWEERDVPIPMELSSRLRKYREENPDQKLVIATASKKPQKKLLRTLKRIVHRAGLDCKVCEPCLKRKECEHWFLHKFRATCITGWLRAGIDVRTVMKLAGHSDLSTTLRYLSPADDQTVRSRIEAVRRSEALLPEPVGGRLRTQP